MNDIFTNNDGKINLYELLEIKENSSTDDIKKAWKKLALKYHPDKNNNKTSDKFLKIKNAYDILSNDELRKEYDEKIKLNKLFSSNFNNGLNIFDINLKNYLSNFINSTEIDKIIELILHKKVIMNDLLNITNGFCNNFNDFISKLTNIEIILNYNLKDIWECKPTNIKYARYTTDVFEELILPIDFIQVYENEGEQIIINNIKYKGNLVIKINIINTYYGGENYYIYDNDLYVLIDKKRIYNNKFTLNFLDGNKYKFNITKLNKISNKLGDVYYKKNFGLPKFTNFENEKNSINTNISIIEIEKNIQYSNLFFIIILY